MKRASPSLIAAGCGLLLAMAGGTAAFSADAVQRCRGIAQAMQGEWPDKTTRIVSADFRRGGTAFTAVRGAGPPAPPVILPAHCEVIGVLQERTGTDGRSYGIRFHVRLPEAWNERLLFEGGAGSDGVLVVRPKSFSV